MSDDKTKEAVAEPVEDGIEVEIQDSNDEKQEVTFDIEGLTDGEVELATEHGLHDPDKKVEEEEDVKKEEEVVEDKEEAEEVTDEEEPTPAKAE